MSKFLRVEWAPAAMDQALARLIRLRDEGGTVTPDDMDVMCAIDMIRTLHRVDRDDLPAEPCGALVVLEWIDGLCECREWSAPGNGHEVIDVANIRHLWLLDEPPAFGWHSTAPCSHESATGVDTTPLDDPGKRWRCDTCGAEYTYEGEGT